MEELVESWITSRVTYQPARSGEAPRIAELEARIERVVGEKGARARPLLDLLADLVDAAEAVGDLARAEAAQIRLLDLWRLHGASFEALEGEYERLRRLVVRQHRPETPAQPVARPGLRMPRRRQPLRCLPPGWRVTGALEAQRARSWADASGLLVRHLSLVPDDPIARVNRVICALQMGLGAEERLTPGHLLATAVGPSLAATFGPALTTTLQLLGLLCCHAAGDRELGRRHALHLAALPLSTSALPGVPRCVTPAGRLEDGGVEPVILALEDLVERTSAGRERSALEELLTRYRERALRSAA